MLTPPDFFISRVIYYFFIFFYRSTNRGNREKPPAHSDTHGARSISVPLSSTVILWSGTAFGRCIIYGIVVGATGVVYPSFSPRIRAVRRYDRRANLYIRAHNDDDDDNDYMILLLLLLLRSRVDIIIVFFFFFSDDHEVPGRSVVTTPPHPRRVCPANRASLIACIYRRHKLVTRGYNFDVIYTCTCCTEDP